MKYHRFITISNSFVLSGYPSTLFVRQHFDKMTMFYTVDAFVQTAISYFVSSVHSAHNSCARARTGEERCALQCILVALRKCVTVLLLLSSKRRCQFFNFGKRISIFPVLCLVYRYDEPQVSSDLFLWVSFFSLLFNIA